MNSQKKNVSVPFFNHVAMAIREKALRTDVKNTKTGWGLYTNRYILKGTFTIEYLGEVIDSIKFNDRFDATKDLYFAELTDELFIDSTMCGNISRFVNHSCQPNARLIKWVTYTNTSEHLRLGLVADRNIIAVCYWT